MGDPKVNWLPGRTDFIDDSKLLPRGRLPDGAKGADHVRSVLMWMGFNDQEIVALSRAHNLARCYTDRSGFERKWVHSPTRFSNQYFRLLTRLEWKPKKLDNSVLQFVHVDEDLGEGLMMLLTDMALLTDPSFKEWVVRKSFTQNLRRRLRN